MSLTASLAKRSVAFKHMHHAAANPTRSLNDIRSDIWKLRSEYWYRKAVGYPQVIRQAKAEACELYYTKWTRPAEWTWGDLVAGSIVGVQIAGAFVIGEMLGRESVIGYYTGEH